jgi:hypothetical protein
LYLHLYEKKQTLKKQHIILLKKKYCGHNLKNLMITIIHSMFSLILVNASQAGAGNLEIIVSVSGRNVPNYVQSEGNARFRVNFKPQEAAPHLLSVRFNGELVPGKN